MRACSLDNVPSSSWNRWYMKSAVAALERSMGDNEHWLLRALLGCNHDAIVFSDLADKRWRGRRGRDHLYGFMTEKDIQARMAAELLRIDRRCHVHVEVPIYGKTNQKKYKRSKPYNLRPDIFLLSTRRKAKAKTREDHLEATAVEIKYFEKYHNPWIKEMINDDVWKLRRYLKRVSPKVDNGFFLCVDETGRAASILESIFRRRWMRGQRVGYFVLVPEHVIEGRDYPMELQQYQPGLERSSVYVMDKALGMLKSEFSPSFDREVVGCDYNGDWKGSAGPWFYIRVGNKRIGWAYFDWKFKVGKAIRPVLAIRLLDEADHIGNRPAIKWKKDLEAFRYSDRDSDDRGIYRVYLETSRSFGYDLTKMNNLADEIYREVSKVVRKRDRVCSR